MEILKYLHCESCGAGFPADGEIQDFCPTCGQRFGTLECILDYEKVRNLLAGNPLSERSRDSILRYDFLLPIKDLSNFPPLKIGMTPVYQRNRAAEALGVRGFWIMDDGLNPSGSYKDRASAVVVARAADLGYPVIACASTGNAAASLATCCAAAQIRCIVFVPENAPQAKLVQIAASGAELIAVRGSYDQAFDLATEACRKFGWFNRSAGLNPYLVEGKKTGAFELCEATGMNPPDAVFAGVGDGSVIAGICKGFQEFKTLGLIPHVPRVFGVQAEGASVLKTAFDTYIKTGQLEIIPEPVETCADSICVGNPREGVRAVRAVHQTGGCIMAVSDQDICAAIKTLPLNTGVFCEPAGAVGYAGIRKALDLGLIDSGQTVAMINTGSGLKDIQGVKTAIKMEIHTINPYIKEVESLHLIGR